MIIKTKKTNKNSLFINERNELLPMITNQIIRESLVKFRVESISSKTKYDETGKPVSSEENVNLFGVVDTEYDKRFLVYIGYNISEDGKHLINGHYATTDRDNNFISNTIQNDLDSPQSLINYINVKFK